jgi:hypothetical protein
VPCGVIHEKDKNQITGRRSNAIYLLNVRVKISSISYMEIPRVQENEECLKC